MALSYAVAMRSMLPQLEALDELNKIQPRSFLSSIEEGRSNLLDSLGPPLSHVLKSTFEELSLGLVGQQLNRT